MKKVYIATENGKFIEGYLCPHCGKEIIGEEEFKNATYCKIEAVSETEMLNATYYVSENQEDIWYVMELPDGTLQETHVVSPTE